MTPSAPPAGQPGSPRPDSRGRARRLLASILVALGMARLLGFAAVFAASSLQMDYAGMYAAGEALNYGRGASPYLNNFALAPELWDGIAPGTFSRFLWPPPAATFFRPWALLPYAASKAAWTAFLLACVAASLAVVRPWLGLPRGTFLLAAAGAMAGFHPLLIALERGQVDAVNLLLILVALGCVERAGKNRAPQLAGGMLLAWPVLFKLHVIYLAPFLLLRRKPAALAGLGVGLGLAVLAGVAAEGPAGVRDYWLREFPRVSGLREVADPSLPPGVLPPLGTKGGARYETQAFRFAANASEARVLHRLFTDTGLGRAISGSHASLMIFALLLLAVAGVLGTGRLGRPLTPLDAALFWFLAMTVVLLAGPLTWTMNLVWLVPLGPALLAAWRDLRAPEEGRGLALAAAGWLLLALPDHISVPLVAPIHPELFDDHYVLAGLLTLVGLLVLLRGRLSRDAGAMPHGGAAVLKAQPSLRLGSARRNTL